MSTARSRAAESIGFPCVVKPLDGNHGRGVSLDLRDEADVRKAFPLALAQSRAGDVVVETYVTGNDYRCWSSAAAWRPSPSACRPA